MTTPKQLPSIELKYLLVSHIAWLVDQNSGRWCDDLWSKDIKLHLGYISNLRIAAPTTRMSPTHRHFEIGRDLEFRNIRYIDLPEMDSRFKFILNFPRMLVKLWNAIGDADIVHIGVIGWPIPIGWIAFPFALLRKRYIVVVIESAPWRQLEGNANFFLRTVSSIREYIVRRIVFYSNFKLFTHKGYQNQILGANLSGSHVIPASWIDKENIRPYAEAKNEWDLRLNRNSQGIRLLYAGQLIVPKGVRVLLEAMEQLKESGLDVELTILGDGPLREECEKRSSAIGNRIILSKSIKYGESFFKFIGKFDAVIVPSISDEQPRIVYDAFSQAVPVLASNNPGLRSCVEEGVSGRFFNPNDADAIVEVIHWAKENRLTLSEMGMRSLEKAKSLTHQRMHALRHQLLVEELRNRTKVLG